jgi:hypothetical protein
MIAETTLRTIQTDGLWEGRELGLWEGSADAAKTREMKILR